MEADDDDVDDEDDDDEEEDEEEEMEGAGEALDGTLMELEHALGHYMDMTNMAEETLDMTNVAGLPQELRNLGNVGVMRVQQLQQVKRFLLSFLNADYFFFHYCTAAGASSAQSSCNDRTYIKRGCRVAHSCRTARSWWFSSPHGRAGSLFECLQ